MENDNIQTLVNNALKHFEIHAAQRIQVLNFYIVIESLFLTGALALISSKLTPLIGIAICIAISFFAICFYLMDLRMKYMIKSSEIVLKNLEKKLSSNSNLCVFRYTETYMNKTKINNHRIISWSKILNCIYCFFFIIGILGMIFFIILCFYYY